MAAYPHAEDLFRIGDEAGARNKVNRGVKLPDLRETDTWVIRLWEQMTSRMATPGLLARRCRAAGFDEDETLEVEQRVIAVDAAVLGYVAERAAMQAH